MRWW